MARHDLLTFVESLYALESNQRDWLGRIAESARAVFTQENIGAYALTYDASDVAACRFGPVVAAGIENKALLRVLRYDAPRAYRAEPEVVEAVFRKTPFGPGRLLPVTGKVLAMRAELVRLGAADILGLNGVNVDGRGLHVGVLLPGLLPRDISHDLLARLASHLSAAFRLRARVGRGEALERADAILDASGRVEHATGAAKLRDAREALADAGARIDRLRGSVGKRDPERAIAQWKALVDARWSLVDHFERDGKRYLLAHRNDASVAPIALLSERERQVVALAVLGHANKMIGYELGISVSTASVLLSRAAKKLGVRSRAALIAAYEARGRRTP